MCNRGLTGLEIKLSLEIKLVNFEISRTWLILAQTLGCVNEIYLKCSIGKSRCKKNFNLNSILQI